MMKIAHATALERRLLADAPQMRCARGSHPEKFSVAELDRFIPEQHPGDPKDPRVQLTTEDLAAYDRVNQKMAAKVPGLKQVLSDPRAYFNDIKGRFDRQRQLTPEDPYSFDFGDYGVPVLKDVSGALDKELDKVGNQLKEYQGGSKLLAPLHHGDIEDRELGQEYLRALKGEVDSHVKSGKVSYRRLQELGYFCSRALGHFDHGDLSFFERNFLRVDRYLQGYHKASIQQEYQAYRDNDFSLFQAKSGDSGIQMASKAFEHAFFNKERLEMVTLPTMEPLGTGVFMDLQPYSIYLLGIAAEPIPADGFMRPGGDFWLHDLRHSSSMFTKRKFYQTEHHLSPAQIEKLEKKQDVWREEMAEAKRQIPDKGLRSAVSLLAFNLHHDRGIPQLPSSFMPEKADDVCLYLYHALKAAGQPVGFDHPKKTLGKAYSWMRDFWLSRLPQEEAVLSASEGAATRP